MSKYEIGDEVVVVAPEANHVTFEGGEQGDVVGTCPTGQHDVFVKFPNGQEECFSDSELGPASAFKVGDRVRVLESRNHGWSNRKGTIAAPAAEGSGHTWGVRIDPNDGGLSLETNVAFDENELVLLEESPAVPAIRFEVGDRIVVVKDAWGGHDDLVGRRGAVNGVSPDEPDGYVYRIDLEGVTDRYFEARDEELDYWFPEPNSEPGPRRTFTVTNPFDPKILPGKGAVFVAPVGTDPEDEGSWTQVGFVADGGVITDPLLDTDWVTRIAGLVVNDEPVVAKPKGGLQRNPAPVDPLWARQTALELAVKNFYQDGLSFVLEAAKAFEDYLSGDAE